MSLTGTRTEDSAKVVFAYCPAGGTCLTTYTIYKTDPISYELSECGLTPTPLPWQDAVSNLDNHPSITWE